uniref:Uncharacterized protein n=1 Tax=Arcella intermedia TaxID=1963864 RepID=A0A6B2L395_9EUKA
MGPMDDLEQEPPQEYVELDEGIQSSSKRDNLIRKRILKEAQKREREPTSKKQKGPGRMADNLSAEANFDYGEAMYDEDEGPRERRRRARGRYDDEDEEDEEYEDEEEEYEKFIDFVGNEKEEEKEKKEEAENEFMENEYGDPEYEKLQPKVVREEDLFVEGTELAPKEFHPGDLEEDLQDTEDDLAAMLKEVEEEEFSEEDSRNEEGDDLGNTAKMLGEEVDEFYGAAKLMAIDLANTISDAVRKRTVKVDRRAMLRKRWYEKMKYIETRKEQKKKRKEEHKHFVAMASKSPNWFYYKELNYWIHKNALMNEHVRSAIPLILNNPSFDEPTKRRGLDSLQRVIRNAARHDNAADRDLYTGIYKENRNRTTPDTTKDPDVNLPATYEEIIRKAESQMPPEELPRRYAEPLGKPYNKILQY